MHEWWNWVVSWRILRFCRQSTISPKNLLSLLSTSCASCLVFLRHIFSPMWINIVCVGLIPLPVSPFLFYAHVLCRWAEEKGALVFFLEWQLGTRNCTSVSRDEDSCSRYRARGRSPHTVRMLSLNLTVLLQMDVTSFHRLYKKCHRAVLKASTSVRILIEIICIDCMWWLSLHWFCMISIKVTKTQNTVT